MSTKEESGLPNPGRSLPNSSSDSTAFTVEQKEALRIAHELVDAGVPVFVAAPNHGDQRNGEFHLPKEWEHTTPDHREVDRWRPGWALCAVGGHVADFLDIDPRNGGEKSETELREAGHWPRSFGRQATPSGGTHDIISATGERKRTNLLPGVDLQSGSARADAYGKHGRGFAFIAPTVRRSKVTGELAAYRWITEPDMELLAEYRGSDDSTQGIIDRVHAKRSTESARPVSPADPLVTSSQARPTGPREFTPAEAEKFCTREVEALERAPIGEIEEHANRAAVTLAHFVPAIWSAEQAYAILTTALSKTAYDPSHSASRWNADKFIPVLDGRRPSLDDWKAVRKVTPAEVTEPKPDAVEALMAKLLDRDALDALPPVRPLVAGLLDMDSESWIIGEPGGFKSFIALDITCHVGTGRKWRDRVTTQGPAIYIVAEGAKSIRKRVLAWEKTYGTRAEGVYFLPQPVQAADPDAWAALVEVVRRLQPALVVIDTQARCTVGLKENDNSEMGVFIDAVSAMKRASGACVLVVHHTGRDGENARGASALDGAQDTELKVVRPAAKAKRAELTAEIRQDKQKDSDDSEVIKVKLTEVMVGTNEFTGQAETSLALLPYDAYTEAQATAPETPNWQRDLAGNQLEIMQVMRDHGADDSGLTRTQILRYVNERRKERNKDASLMVDSSKNTAINVLVDKGLLVKDGKLRVVLPEYSGQE